MILEIPDDKTLVLQGPHGCGKSRLAVKIAEACGTYSVLDAQDLSSPFTLGGALKDRPDIVIIEDCDLGKRTMTILKALITEPAIQVNLQFRTSYMVPTPRFIICAQASAEPFRAGVEDRRFMVVGL